MKPYMFTRLGRCRDAVESAVEKYRGLRAEYDNREDTIFEIVRNTLPINEIFYNVNDPTHITQEEINNLIKLKYEGGKIVGWDDNKCSYIIEYPVERNNKDVQYRINSILNDIRIYAMSYRDLYEDITVTVREVTGKEDISIDLPKLDTSEFLDENFNFLPEYNEFFDL